MNEAPLPPKRGARVNGRVLARYLLFQLPGWGVAGVLMAVGVARFGLDPRLAVALFAAWVLKDFALFPLLRIAYEPGGRAGERPLVGTTGVAQEPLAPAGYVRVGAELWRAELADPSRAPLAAGRRVRVLSVAGLTLKVEPLSEDELADPTGATWSA